MIDLARGIGCLGRQNGRTARALAFVLDRVAHQDVVAYVVRDSRNLAYCFDLACALAAEAPGDHRQDFVPDRSGWRITCGAGVLVFRLMGNTCHGRLPGFDPGQVITDHACGGARWPALAPPRW